MIDSNPNDGGDSQPAGGDPVTFNPPGSGSKTGLIIAIVLGVVVIAGAVLKYGFKLF